MAFIREKKLRDSFDAIKQDLDIHLDAINENTAEIYENRQMISDLHERICKLSDQLCELKVRLDESEVRFPMNIELSGREQEVFISLYTQASPTQYSDLSRTVSLPIARVQEVVYSLIQKGIPVLKQRSESGNILLSLDIEFKEEQTRRNIVSINHNVMLNANKVLQLSLFD